MFSIHVSDTKQLSRFFFVCVCVFARTVGLFPYEDSVEQMAFELAIHKVNLDPMLADDVRLEGRTEIVNVDDDFRTSKIGKTELIIPYAYLSGVLTFRLLPRPHVLVCDSLESGIGAIFSPAGCSTSAIIQSICNSMEIPHIETHWKTSLNHQPSNGYMNYYLNVYPDPVILSAGYTAIVRDMDWTSFTLLYQRDEALLRLQHLIQDYSGSTKLSNAESSAVAIIKLPENNDFR